MTVAELVRPSVAATRSHPTLRHRLPRSVDVLALGVGSFLLSFIGNWVPSLWYDEVATVSSATRSWSQLWAEVQHVDAVHAAYYSLMHVVFAAFGYSPLVLRLPSAVAIGVTAAAVVVLTRRLSSRRTAIMAGLLFAIMSRVTWAGGEGRSYALTAMVAILLTTVLVEALHSSRRRWWLIYGVLVVVATLLFAYLLFVIAAHVLSVGIRARHGGLRRAQLIPFGVTVVVAAVGLMPFLALIHSEQSQVAWLPSLSWDFVGQVYQTQWFWGSIPGPAISWALLALGASRMIRAGRSELTAIVLPAAFLPTVLIIGVTALGEHLYSPRYLTMCTPFVAITMAVGLSWFSRRGIAAIVIAVLAVFALVHQVTAQRIVEAKSSTSWSEVAAGLSAHRVDLDGAARTGIIFGPVLGHPSGTTRLVEYAYPSAFVGTNDVTLLTPAADTGQLWETHRSLADSTARLQGDDVAYLITSVKEDTRSSTLATLMRLGWRETDQWHYTGINVVRYERG